MHDLEQSASTHNEVNEYIDIESLHETTTPSVEPVAGANRTKGTITSSEVGLSSQSALRVLETTPSTSPMNGQGLGNTSNVQVEVHRSATGEFATAGAPLAIPLPGTSRALPIPEAPPVIPITRAPRVISTPGAPRAMPNSPNPAEVLAANINYMNRLRLFLQGCTGRSDPNDAIWRTIAQCVHVNRFFFIDRNRRSATIRICNKCYGFLALGWGIPNLQHLVPIVLHSIAPVGRVKVELCSTCDQDMTEVTPAQDCADCSYHYATIGIPTEEHVVTGICPGLRRLPESLMIQLGRPAPPNEHGPPGILQGLLVDPNQSPFNDNTQKPPKKRYASCGAEAKKPRGRPRKNP